MSKEELIRKSYTETFLFLSVLPKTYVNKIPAHILDYIKKEQDHEYHPLWENTITKDSDVRDLGLLDETIAFIAWLNLEFFEEDENKKAELRKTYEKNQQIKDMWIELMVANINKRENKNLKS